jgi:hypothetical protein
MNELEILALITKGYLTNEARSDPEDGLASSFLDDVIASCESRKLLISKGRIFWRARLGCETDNIVHHYGDIDVITPKERPYEASGMKPKTQLAN